MFNVLKQIAAIFLISVIVQSTCSFAQGESAISLAGSWQFQLDSKDQGIEQRWFERSLAKTIKLPGTTDEGGFGKPGPQTPDRIGVLTRRHEYLGAAWYSREFTVPVDCAGKSMQLFLERVMWQSQVWVDGKQVSKPLDSLCVPHVHALGTLTPGKHRLTIRIDNRMIHPIGNKNHAYGEQTQTRWNGVVGRIELRCRPMNRIETIRVFTKRWTNAKTEITAGIVSIDVHPTGELSGLKLRAVILDEAGNIVGRSEAIDAKQSALLKVVCDQPVVAWSEFSPTLYRTKVELLQGTNILDTKETTFGLRSISRNGNKLFINGKPAFMRGNLDCVQFVKTGYPSPNKKDWLDIFKKYQAHNLNHVRFHSWCPPEAAFEAADELGIYLQVEGPIWIDYWMTRPDKRPEMDTEGYPKGLGKNDRTVDQFAQAEFRRILDTYGNHPSFMFFCFGNELGPSDFNVTGRWIKALKEYDSRHLYAASTARTITPHCEFNATHSVPGIGGVRQHYEFGTNWDYEKGYSKTSVPIIAHEIGQWPVYPKWSILDKFTGVLHNPLLQAMRDQAIKNGVYDDQEAFTRASGALNQRMYKDEIEGFLRTPSCRGFQLLQIQDFQGQGEAYVGWLDCFWDSKGTTDPKVFRGYCAPLVALAKLKTYIYTDGQSFEAGLLVRNDTGQDIRDQKLTAVLKDMRGQVVAEKTYTYSIENGAVVTVGQFKCLLKASKATPLTFELALQGKEEVNTYPVWVYPQALPKTNADILEANEFDAGVLAALRAGKSVLLDASQLGDESCKKHARWRPLYWSGDWFSGQGCDTLGLVVRKEHPAYRDFPTSDFNDWNWFRICRGARGFDLTGMVPVAYKPIAQPATDFHFNKKLASIFELKVGKGKLLVSGYKLQRSEPEVKQLRYSLINYMNSSAFAPSQELSVQTLQKLFLYTPKAPLATPKGFEKAIFYVQAGSKKTSGGNEVWKEKLDDLKVAKKVTYNVLADGVWKDNTGTAWHGKEISVDFKVPSGLLADMYVHFHDWNHQGRSGEIAFEGRKYKLGKHDGKGAWIKLHVMREDAIDGRLQLKATTSQGGNLMITAIAIVPKD